MRVQLGLEVAQFDIDLDDRPRAADGLSHNLNGQRLGRKGRDTRDRIIAAATELLAEPGNAAFTLSAVARKAGLGMTSLYVYFKDLGELVLALPGIAPAR